MDCVARPSALYRFLAIFSQPVVRGLFRLDVRGLEHVPAGGFVLSANHTSNVDPWPLGIPVYPRWLRFMAKSELYWWPLGRLLSAAGAFPVRRGQKDAEAIATAVRLAQEGNVVAMFPEGTRRTKGLVKRFEARPRSGAARIALEAGVPLVPVAVKGTDKLTRLGRLSVAYGAPVEIDDLRRGDVAESAHAATERLMEKILELEASL